jgi:hypothetical protein
VADDAIDAARDQLVSGLDRDQPAEPMAEYEDRPNPQRSAGREKKDTGQRTVSPSKVQNSLRSV